MTAGRFVLEPNRSGVPIGRLVCDRRYLANPDAVGPIDLKTVPDHRHFTALGENCGGSDRQQVIPVSITLREEAGTSVEGNSPSPRWPSGQIVLKGSETHGEPNWPTS